MSPRATPLPPDERRRAIVEVVVPLLLAHGGECSTKEIAEAAGIAEGTIFRAFPDKLALWRAAAEHVMDPEVELAELAVAAEGAADLRQLVVQVADHLLERSSRVMTVMGVWRGATLAQNRSGDHGHERGKLGPPGFMIEANRALMSGLATLFEPYAADLSVTPSVAASVLRTLALGSRHPGAHADHLLVPDEIADVMLDGVRKPHSLSESVA